MNQISNYLYKREKICLFIIYFFLLSSHLKHSMCVPYEMIIIIIMKTTTTTTTNQRFIILHFFFLITIYTFFIVKQNIAKRYIFKK